MMDLRHDLRKILALARRRKLGRVLLLQKRDLESIHAIHDAYSTHRLRYMVKGTIQLPHLAFIGDAAETLVVGLEEYCTGRRGQLHAFL